MYLFLKKIQRLNEKYSFRDFIFESPLNQFPNLIYEQDYEDWKIYKRKN